MSTSLGIFRKICRNRPPDLPQKALNFEIILLIVPQSFGARRNFVSSPARICFSFDANHVRLDVNPQEAR
jgi:hypothetical protein